MRRRINKLAIASSDNYSQSKRVHRQMLLDNHNNNQAVFMAISTTNNIQDSLHSFELGLKDKINNFLNQRR